MPEFVVKQILDQWCVVNNSIIWATSATPSQAVARAVALATETASMEGPKRVVYERNDHGRTVIWNSEKDD